jgi:hypothetical protein
MHIRARFNYTEGNIEEMQTAVNNWRSMLNQEMP